MSGLVVAGILAGFVAAVGGGAFVALALFLGIPRPERDDTRRRAF
jgi:hypothetical protein